MDLVDHLVVNKNTTTTLFAPEKLESGPRSPETSGPYKDAIKGLLTEGS